MIPHCDCSRESCLLRSTVAVGGFECRVSNFHDLCTVGCKVNLWESIVSNKIEVAELPEFDAAEYLKNEEDVAAYLTTVLEDDDPALLAAAIGDIDRARGMLQFAKGSSSS